MTPDAPPEAGDGGLAGLRVIELNGGIGVAWAAKLFADLGADVVRVEDRPDVVRERPHGIHRWLNANKRSVTDGLEDSTLWVVAARPGMGKTALGMHMALKVARSLYDATERQRVAAEVPVKCRRSLFRPSLPRFAPVSSMASMS